MAASVEVTRVASKAVFSPCIRNLCRLTQAKHAYKVHQRCLSEVPAKSQDQSVGNAGSEKAKEISQAMRAYLERAQAHNKFMEDEIAEYEIGKRHLANIMSLDPDSMTQEDIDKAIEYLMPSGLFEKKARPMMKHPTEVIPQRKAAQFGLDGRPHHHMFYTGYPNFFNLLHDIVQKTEALKKHEDDMRAKGRRPSKANKFNLAGSSPIQKEELQHRLNENLPDVLHDQLNKLIERLADQTYSQREADFIRQYRKDIQTVSLLQELPKMQEDENGRKYIDASGRRKDSTAEVRLYAEGTGQFTVNGQGILHYFPRLMDREQLMYPLQFVDKMGEVDIEATVTLGGPAGQAGAIRFAISNALRSCVDAEMVEKMRLAGLLTRDPRVRERKKPGQKGARAKFTWKKR